MSDQATPGEADAKAASEGFTLEVAPDPLATAVELLRRVQAAGNLPDTLSQAVYAFVKAHG